MTNETQITVVGNSVYEAGLLMYRALTAAQEKELPLYVEWLRAKEAVGHPDSYAFPTFENWKKAR